MILNSLIAILFLIKFPMLFFEIVASYVIFHWSFLFVLYFTERDHFCILRSIQTVLTFTGGEYIAYQVLSIGGDITIIGDAEDPDEGTWKLIKYEDNIKAKRMKDEEKPMKNGGMRTAAFHCFMKIQIATIRW